MLMQDKVGLVTGGGSGIGRATALALAREGARVVLMGRDENKLVAVRNEILSTGGSADFQQGDASKREDQANIVAFIEARYGRFDFAFNNAGGHVDFKPIAHTSVEESEWVIDLNFKGVYYAVKYQIEAMLRYSQGAIVNNASIFGLRGTSGIAHYVASKHAVVGLTRAVAKEYGRQNIRVNAVCPGATETPNFLRSATGDIQTLEDSIPMGRIGQPRDVAEAVLWLLSDQAKYVTGTTLSVDGGKSI